MQLKKPTVCTQDTKWVKILQVEQYVNEFIPNRP